MVKSMTREEAVSSTTPVYSLILNDTEYIYRKISLKEYAILDSASTDDYDLQDLVVVEALLFPETDILSMPAGTFELLYVAIMETSCMTHVQWAERILDYKRVISQSSGGFKRPIGPLIIKICKAFPAYKPEDIMEMDVETMLQRAAWADALLNGFEEVDTKSIAKNGINNERTNEYTNGYTNGYTNEYNNSEPFVDVKGTSLSVKKWAYSQGDLEKISADNSAEALKREMEKYRNRSSR
jgi:hypothetical protein